MNMTKPKTHHDFNPVGFGLAPMKREGDVQDPDALTAPSSGRRE